ncbi:MAG: hypothetical protein LBH93_00155 [Chitinispirillales bacterium]|jgi:hypothetical protein|nr:hypothetical protein [Chitinispirillales bacterium]
MNTLVVAIVAVFIITVVYFILANKIGGEEGTRTFLNSNDSESSNRVVIMFLPKWISCPLAVFAVVAVVYLAVQTIDRINGNIFSWGSDGVDCVMALVFVPLLVSACNIKHIFDDDGVTTKAKLYLAFFVIYKENVLTPWRDFFSVDYTDIETPYSHRSICIGLRSFKLHTVEKRFIPIFFILNNDRNRQCLVLAAKHMNKWKVRIDAQNRLKKMGLWPYERSG